MTYLNILTSVGAAKLAAATANNTTVNLTSIAVGDGNGTVPTPVASQTILINEVFRANLNDLRIDANNDNWIVTEGYIPATDGNFWIREVGIFDEEGDLIAVGNYPETFKPVLADNVAKDLYIQVIIEVANADSVAIQIDPSVVLATREHVAREIAKIDMSSKADISFVNSEIEKVKAPIGSQSFEIIETPRINQLVQLGGEFLRADYPALWTFIQTQTNLLLTEANWQTENTTNGMCGKFSSGDGSTTFRLMNLDKAFLRAVDGVVNTVGRYEADEFKSHQHDFRDNTTANTTQAGGSNRSTNFYTSQTGATGGDETRPENIGALPLIIAL